MSTKRVDGFMMEWHDYGVCYNLFWCNFGNQAFSILSGLHFSPLNLFIKCGSQYIYKLIPWFFKSRKLFVKTLLSHTTTRKVIKFRTSTAKKFHGYGHLPQSTKKIWYFLTDQYSKQIISHWYNKVFNM